MRKLETMTTPEPDPTSDHQNGAAWSRSSEGDGVPDGPNRGHLSETVKMDQWLRLLVVVTTLLLLILLVAVAVRLLSAIGHTLLLFSLGALLAYALDPLVEKLRAGRQERNVRVRSVMAVYGIMALVAILAVELLSSSLVKQIRLLSEDHAIYTGAMKDRELGIATPQELQEAASTYEGRTQQMLRSTDLWLADHNVHINLEDQFVHPPSNMKELGRNFAGHALKFLEEFSKSAAEGIIVLLITLYFLIYCEEMREGLNRALPARLRPYAEHWEDDVNRILGGFVRGQLILALVTGALAAALCLVLGLHLWLLIGLFVVVASLIPVIGPYIGAIPALIASAVTPATGPITPLVRVVIVLVAFIVINEVGSKVLYPKLVGKALGLHEVLVLFILFAGLEVDGLLGVLYAAPLTALSAVTLAQLYRLWQGEPPRSMAAAQRQGEREAKAEGAP
jgi:predicted PurR-regulated permease PerM